MTQLSQMTTLSRWASQRASSRSLWRAQSQPALAAGLHTVAGDDMSNNTQFLLQVQYSIAHIKPLFYILVKRGNKKTDMVLFRLK
jgi:hypothetical protein